MRMGRRAFLAGAGCAVVGPPAFAHGGKRVEDRGVFVSCAVDLDRRYTVAGVDGRGEMRFMAALPGRGHGFAVHPSRRELVVFARRPGTFAVVVQTSDGAVRHRIESPPDRHFCGHGAFSRDGGMLFATENDYESGHGVIGLYDCADGYRRVGEWQSHGIGPHEVRLSVDGRSLVVANGGIRTHPDYGRAKLNVASMAPNLTYLDVDTGRPLETVRLGDSFHKLSIRHIDVNASGLVAIGMQYEGDRRKQVPLVALHKAGGTVRLLQAPAEVARRMRHYIGSVAFDAGGRFVAATSPRGHIVTVWDIKAGAYHGCTKATDASGVAPTVQADEFLIAGGDGVLRLVNARSGGIAVLSKSNPERRWDNHLGYAMATL